VTYNLRNGYSVRTTKVDAGTEFMTSNPQGDVISTVVLGDTEARNLVLSILKGSR
jgi:hypothetical protein